ncbi:MAG: glycosyltransferase family 2 protein [Nostochopsis sp.]
MKVSVIIPCLNVEKTIAVQLEALAHQQWSQAWEVIISDNGSTDSTLSIVEKYKMILPNLRVVDASDRTGASHARNVAAKVAKGEAILFIDADDEVAPGWLAAMGEALLKYDFVAGHNDYNKLSNAWVVKCYQLENGSGVMENTYYLPFAGSGNLGIKRAIHEKLGGFDETLYQSEDVDYCWRASYIGIKLHYVPDAIAYIRLRDSLASIYCRSWNVGKGGILVYKKHRPLGMPQLVSWKTLLKTSVILTMQLLLLQIRDKESLVKWLMSFAWRGGQFWGCIKYQYLPL